MNVKLFYWGICIHFLSHHEEVRKALGTLNGLLDFCVLDLITSKQ